MRKSTLVLLLLAVVLISIRFTACKHEPVFPVVTPPPTPPPSTTCSPDTVFFQNEILPMFQSYCAKSGCHDGTGEAADLTSYEAIFSQGIVPGDPSASRVYSAITVGGEEGKMPPSNQPQLDSTQIQHIAKWITQGALNSQCTSTGCDSLNVGYAATIAPIIQTYCLGCHSAPNPAASINLMTYDAVVSVCKSGRLMGAIKQLPGYFAMPQSGGKLSDCVIAQFQNWINGGYKP